jgi:hypothetical protein
MSIWTDGCDIPYEGAAPAGNDFIFGYIAEREWFPMITREAMRADAARRGHGHWIVKARGPRNRKFYGSDFGWLEIPYEDDLAQAVGL